MPTDRLRLVIATRNRKKCEEMCALVAPPWDRVDWLKDVDVLTLADTPNAPEVDEDADTFSGNAQKKAAEVARALGTWVIADDSGLAVVALGGAPGVYSARYAGTHGDDQANNARLLSELANVDDQDRGAAFRCALAVADPTGSVRAAVEGAVRGRIIRQPRGLNGFGYDPLFLIREYHRTFGELHPIVKQQISHRARAFTLLRPQLRRLLAE